MSGEVLFGAGFFALFFGAIQFLSFVWDYDTMQAGPNGHDRSPSGPGDNGFFQVLDP